MSLLQVGDRVRRIKNSGHGVSIGWIAVVSATRVDEDNRQWIQLYDVKRYDKSVRQDSIPWIASSFELITNLPKENDTILVEGDTFEVERLDYDTREIFMKCSEIFRFESIKGWSLVSRKQLI